MRLYEDIERYRKGLYKEYKLIREREGLGKKAAIEKMVQERLSLEDRFDRWKREDEYNILHNILKCERRNERNEEREVQRLIAVCDKLDGRVR